MTESQVLRQVTDWLTSERIFWIRMNSGAMKGTYNGKTRFVRFGQPGMADILALQKNGGSSRGPSFTPIWVECKTEVGRQSEAQKSFARFVEEQGHFYVVARSFEDVAQVLGKRVGG